MITAGNLMKCIGKIEAREMLNQIVVSNFPNLDKNQKKSLVKSLESQAEVKVQKPTREVSNSDLNEWLKGIFRG